jgi:hypothetical protein
MQATGHAVPSDHRLRQSKLFLQNVFSITERLVHPGTQLLQISNVLNSIFHWYVHRVGMSSQGDGVALRDGRFATANAGGYRRWIIACWNPGVGVATPGTKDISFAFRKTVKLAMSRVKVQIGVWQGSSSVGLPVTCHIGQTGDLSDGPAGLEGGGDARTPMPNRSSGKSRSLSLVGCSVHHLRDGLARKFLSDRETVFEFKSRPSLRNPATPHSIAIHRRSSNLVGQTTLLPSQMHRQSVQMLQAS